MVFAFVADRVAVAYLPSAFTKASQDLLHDFRSRRLASTLLKQARKLRSGVNKRTDPATGPSLCYSSL